jgi:sec-independent protein translocase protein TatA
MLLVFFVILLLFGSKRIPEVARGLARGLHEFRKATREIMDEVQSAAADPPSEDATTGPPASKTPPEDSPGDPPRTPAG